MYNKGSTVIHFHVIVKMSVPRGLARNMANRYVKINLDR